MEKKEFNLKIFGYPSEFGKVNELEDFRFPNGKKFPRSYKNFVLQYGYGLALEEFHFYIPMDDYGDSLFIRTEEIKKTYLDDVKNGDIWFDIEPDGSLELLYRLFPFASSDNGLYLFWDYETGSANEMDIYLTDFRGIGFRRVGHSHINRQGRQFWLDANVELILARGFDLIQSS
ncbi:MAG: SMI1/KNR4 family protein [Sphingobacterium sp.]